MDPLTDKQAVEVALLRPLTATEANYIDGLCVSASALLRQRAPSIDDRIARYAADATDSTAVDPEVVAAILAGVIKRYLVNPEGVVSTSEGAGPYSRSKSFALRSDKDRRGALEVTDEDVAALFPSRKRLRAGTIRTRAALAPRPVGRYGPPPTVTEAVEAVETFQDGTPSTAPLRLDLL